MWKTETTTLSIASPKEIWNLWADVTNWNRWDQAVVASELNGAFQAGTSGALIPNGSPKAAFELVEVAPCQRFVVHTRPPLATLIFRHELTPEGMQTRITHQVEIVGPLSGLFARFMGKSLMEGLPLAVKRLAYLAEGGDA